MFGGPIKKDKTFFFGGYEGLRQGLGNSQIATVPTLEARQGILPTDSVPVNPVVTAIWRFIPRRMAAILVTGLENLSPPPRS